MAKKQKINLGLPTNKNGTVNKQFAERHALELNKDGTLSKRSAWNKDFAKEWGKPAPKKPLKPYQQFTNVFNELKDDVPLELDFAKAKKSMYAGIKGKSFSKKKLKEYVSAQFNDLVAHRRKLQRAAKKKERFKYLGRYVSEHTQSRAMICCADLIKQGYKCEYKYIIWLWFKIVDEVIDNKKWLHQHQREMGFEMMNDMERAAAESYLRQLEHETLGIEAIKNSLTTKRDKIIASYLSFSEGYAYREEVKANQIQHHMKYKKIRIRIREFGKEEGAVEKFQPYSFTIALSIIDVQLNIFWKAKEMLHIDYPGESQAYAIYYFFEQTTTTSFVDFNDFIVENMNRNDFLTYLYMVNNSYLSAKGDTEDKFFTEQDLQP